MIYERDGSASYGILTAIADDGTRVLRSTGSRSDLDSLPDGPVTGLHAVLPADGGFSLG